MAEIYDLSAIAGNNNAAPPDGFPEFMDYSAVNDAGRELMAKLARWRSSAFGGIVATTGTAPNYALVSGLTFGAYVPGMVFAFTAHATSTGLVFLNVDGKGAGAVLDSRGVQIGRDDIVLNGLYWVVRTAAAFRLIGQLSAATLAAAPRQAFLSAGAANVYTITPGGAPVYADGQIYWLIAHQANAAACQFSVDAQALETLLDANGQALAAGDIVNPRLYMVGRTGGAWRLLTSVPIDLAAQVSGVLPVANGGTGAATAVAAATALAQGGAGFGAITGVASAATVDLGALPTHYVNITGTTTVTSFGGAAASASTPVYLLRFAGNITVNHSANISLPGGANHTFADNDHVLMRFQSNNVWQCIGIFRSNSAATDTLAGLIELATVAEMVTATDVARAVVPGRQMHHPAHAKASLRVNMASGTPVINTSFGVSSVADNGSGVYTVTFSTAFLAATGTNAYGPTGFARAVSGSDLFVCGQTGFALTTTTIGLRNVNSATSTDDGDISSTTYYGPQ